MSIFDFEFIAKNYDEGRPHFSPAMMDKIKKVVGSHSRFDEVADINCGSGESTWALREMAKHIIATDPAKVMLNLAPSDPKIDYRVSRDTKLDLPEKHFDFALLQLTFHWLDRKKILEEAHRVLKTGGWLVMYQNSFAGEMHFGPEFAEWYEQTFLPKMSIPGRDATPMTVDEAEDRGFEWIERERYSHDVAMSVSELSHYLLTHITANAPNLTTASQEEIETLWNQNKEWLESEMKPFFRKKRMLFPFGGSIWYLKCKIS